MVLNNVTVSPLVFLRSKATLLVFHEQHTVPFCSAPAPSDAVGKVLAQGSGSSLCRAEPWWAQAAVSIPRAAGQFRPSDVQGNPGSQCSQENWDLHLIFFLLSVHGLGFATICLL